MRQGRKLYNIYKKNKDDITVPPVLKGKHIDYLRNQFLALDPKLVLSDEGLKAFKSLVNPSDWKQAMKVLYGPNWPQIINDQHLMRKIVAHDDLQQLLEDQQEQRAQMQIEVEENFKRLVKENEGINDPRYSEIQTSQPIPIDRNINARLAGPQNQMGSMAQPPNPDTQFKELGEVAPKEYVETLKETDEEQPFQYSAEEDALQQQIYDTQITQSEPQRYTTIPNQMGVNDIQSISNFRNRNQMSQFQQEQMQQARAEDQMSENLQAANDKVINGLKYLVGSTGWGKQPINAYFNKQHFPDRTFQWYTNEGQTVLRQAKVKLSKQQLLNIPAKKKNYIKTKEIEKALKAQKQLRKK
ncbi:MAG: hypothetical protein EZS28_027659 [Streblomastix strix]|uniref:Uncharacterized protein n=1 Tax=Streblomastix strix TaxID=222440 RepID=A0A5J4V2T5_9EUKA|nr:MAG: hypothetical protein EZS28_027659 [Streblomastix strix]